MGKRRRGSKKRKYKQTHIEYPQKKRVVAGPSRMIGAAGAAVGAAAGASGTYTALTAASHLPSMFEWQAPVEGLSASGLFELAEAAAYVGAEEAVMMSGAAVAGPVALAAGAGYLIATGIASLFSQKDSSLSITAMASGFAGTVAKKGKNSVQVRNKYQGVGAVVIDEIFGEVADPDMVGVGHVSWAQTSVQRAIVFSLLRKLFYKAGARIQTPYETIELITNDGDTSGPGFRLIWESVNADQTFVYGTYDIPQGASLSSIYNQSTSGSSLETIIANMIRQPDPVQLQKICLYQMGTGSALTSANRLAAQLILKHEKIDITVNSHIVIQNRTLTATASTSTTSVDVQPLKGPVFEFSGVPRTKEGGVAPLNSTYDAAGVFLFRKGELTGTDVQAWAEPPVRKAFTNVVKSAYTRLNAGSLKDMEISKTWEGTFESVLSKWRVIAGTRMSYCPGQAQIVFLEEEMNSGSANNIRVFYECQHTVGCMFTTTKSPNMQPHYSSNPKSNVPA